MVNSSVIIGKLYHPKVNQFRFPVEVYNLLCAIKIRLCESFTKELQTEKGTKHLKLLTVTENVLSTYTSCNKQRDYGYKELCV